MNSDYPPSTITLLELHNEYDYDTLCKKIMSTSLISNLKSTYSSFNPKLLLSAYIFKNFKENFNIDEAFHLASISICNSLTYDDTDIHTVYDDFIHHFQIWKQKDIYIMRDDIQNMTTELKNTLIKDPKEDYDIQWNQGVNDSIMKMDKCLKDIEKF
tara:strand:+ start:265 stop:735 length:471 start_codon:yes stop_codon:yes gene_type:complete